MYDLYKYRIKSKWERFKCLVGFHQYSVVEEYSTIKTPDMVILEYRHKCHVCEREEDVTEAYTQGEGCRREITFCWYDGSYGLGELLRTLLVKFKGMF